MKYFLDTEFIEAGRNNPVTLISIGIVAEDGRSFYAISSEYNPDDANDWVKKNVLPHLNDIVLASTHLGRVPVATIAQGIRDFIGEDIPEFWGYYADYDWVVLCQLFGRMIDLPKGWPMFCRDIKQVATDLGNPRLPKQNTVEHNALSDARWNKLTYEFLAEKFANLRIVGKNSGVGMITDERLRQIKEEGYSPEHDDKHDKGELAEAASCYCDLAAFQAGNPLAVGAVDLNTPMGWPWGREYWKPSPDPILNLKRSGALIAAEIDRLLRAKSEERP